VTLCDKGLELAELTDIAAVIVAALNLLAGALGGAAWYLGEAGRPFWTAVRAGQLSTTLLAVLALILLFSGYDPDSNLLYLYLVLPIVVSIIAEQLRIASAQTILDQRELENAQAVGALPEAEQMRIVQAIMRREAGVMTIAAFVIAFLALRVLATV
jgi:hypothetical protein